MVALKSPSSGVLKGDRGDGPELDPFFKTHYKKLPKDGLNQILTPQKIEDIKQYQNFIHKQQENFYNYKNLNQKHLSWSIIPK